MDNLQQQQNQFPATDNPQAISQPQLHGQPNNLQNNISNNQNLSQLPSQLLEVIPSCTTNCSTAVPAPAPTKHHNSAWIGITLVTVGVAIIAILISFFLKLKPAAK